MILGFGPQGQMVANMLSSPLAATSQPYIGFDLDPARVSASQAAGFTVSYGDGSRSDVLKAAGAAGAAVRVSVLVVYLMEGGLWAVGSVCARMRCIWQTMYCV